MIRISLTQFVNFATKEPEKQLTVVRAVKKQHEQGYRVPPDLYKQFIARVVWMHKHGRPKEELDGLAVGQTEPSRAKHYPLLVKGYKKFLGRKQVQWFKPHKGFWEHGGLIINASPELGLAWDGRKHLVKMYCNDGKDLNKRRSEIIAHLMDLAIPDLPDDVVPMVLDVRKGKPVELGEFDREQTILLQGLAQSFVHIYRNL